MPVRKKVVAICGSTKAASTNLKYIQAFAALGKAQFETAVFVDLAGIPHFNPDLDTDDPPAPVSSFRMLLRQADGILICTPEYAMGVPGTLKNAIDWTVSSMEFSKKPVALITASSVGEKGHRSLLETLHILEAGVVETTQLLIPFAKTKINAAGEITHQATLAEIQTLIVAFSEMLQQNAHRGDS
jgi:chromate reductase, NAD(P)H dehydrogenase (quinone)